MIVLHALWDHRAADATGRLHIWAESSQMPLPVGAGRKARGRQPQKEEKPREHPFALHYELLRQSLGELVGRLHISGGEASTLDVRLPSTDKGPLASPELILDEVEALQATAFLPYTVPTLALTPDFAFDALLALPSHPPHGVAYGAALRYWATAASFAYELIARQSYMPVLRESRRDGETVLLAGWNAVLAPEDAERARQLALMMPPLCWSWLPPGERKNTLPPVMLRQFLDQSIDAFVRGSLVTTRLLPAAPSARKGRVATRPLPERWLRALATDNPTLTASDAERKQFVAAVQGWLGQLRPGGQDAPFRTCFRLDPPSEEEDGHESNWHVNFFLQANDDRSLLVPAELVWKERSSTLTFLKRSFENPQERLLADLARAARLFPAIEESLRTARPSALEMQTEQAYTFLRESAPLLEQSGFGVLVPPWWQKASARLGVKLKMKAGAAVASGMMGLDSIVNYDWTVAIGDTSLTAKEFENLVRLKIPLVKVRGQWVELRPEEIEKAIAFLRKKHSNGQMSLGEALRTGLGHEQSELGLPVLDVEGEGWIADLLAQLSDGAKIELIDSPATFQGQLRPYQLRGTSWLAFLRQYGLGGCLADDMGLGKCLGASSLVTVNGLLQKAEDMWTHYAGQATFDGEGYWAEPTEQLLTNSIDETSGQVVQSRVRRLYRQHVSERLRKIRLEDESSVTITYPHKLLTDKGWTNNLYVGDYVCVPAKLVWNGQSEDPDLVKILAWQIAEGYEICSTSRLTITQKDSNILDELRNSLLRLGEKYKIKVNSSPIVTYQNRRAPYLSITSLAYRRFLETKGYVWGNLSSEKRIPDFIMQADLDSVRIFLRNFFEAEASVVESMRSIEISTASPMLIQQLSTLLRRFGIWMRTSTKQKRATNGSGIYRPYQIGVLGGNAARIFCKEVGFVSDRKQQKLERVCEKVNNTNVEGIPASGIMAEVVASTGLPIRHFGMKTVYVTGTQQFSSASLKQVITGCDTILSGEAELAYQQKPASKWTIQTLNAYSQLDKPLLATTRAQLQRLVHQEVFYCKIRDIEEVQYDGWVYDFEVEDHHNFVADGILCHNTIQLITLLLHDREIGYDEQKRSPALLICPMSIVGNWQRELQRFAPSLKVMIHHGHERLAGEAFVAEARQNDVVITTYSLALRDREHLASIEWEYVVVDEAQNIKNEAAKQSQAIKAIKARHKIALTGTPVENRLSELWSIMEFLNPGYLGSPTDFRQQFAIPVERYHDAERAETLKNVIQPFLLRRLKTDKSIIADLPDKMEMRVYCNLTREQATLYEAVVKEMMEKIEDSEGIERRGLVLATLMKLKQICNHPAQFVGDGSALPGRSGKLARLEEMLEEALAAGDKALVFSQFAEMGGLLRHQLQEVLDCEALFLHGGTPKKMRDSMVQRFQEQGRGAPPIFILSLKAGGVGLNLTAANHVFHFDRWWNPAVENQATDRAFRIGQLKNVQVHKFVCVGTLEERIDAMIEQKKELAESIVGSGESWLTEMSNTELKELFALSREAVGE